MFGDSTLQLRVTGVICFGIWHGLCEILSQVRTINLSRIFKELLILRTYSAVPLAKNVWNINLQYALTIAEEVIVEGV